MLTGNAFCAPSGPGASVLRHRRWAADRPQARRRPELGARAERRVPPADAGGNGRRDLETGPRRASADGNGGAGCPPRTERCRRSASWNLAPRRRMPPRWPLRNSADWGSGDERTDGGGSRRNDSARAGRGTPRSPGRNKPGTRRERTMEARGRAGTRTSGPAGSGFRRDAPEEEGATETQGQAGPAPAFLCASAAGGVDGGWEREGQSVGAQPSRGGGRARRGEFLRKKSEAGSPSRWRRRIRATIS